MLHKKFHFCLFKSEDETQASSTSHKMPMLNDNIANAYQAVEKRPSASFPSSIVIAAYVQVRLIPGDFGALHLGIFEQPEK
jgi:hypothetical protein